MKKKIRYSDLTDSAPAQLTRFTPVWNEVVTPERAAPERATVAPSETSESEVASTDAIAKRRKAKAAPKAKASPKPKAAAKVKAESKPAKAKRVRAAAPDSAPVAAPVEQPAPRARRDSAPIELARALQQARAAEARQAAETLAHVEARAAAAHARDLAKAEAAALAAAADGDGSATPAEPARAPFVYARMAAPGDSELDDDLPELRGPRRPLRERARSRTGIAELLMFRIGNERFAVELVCVEEAIDLPDVHHVPEMPPAMLGVITVRDTLTPVFTPDDALGVPVQGRGAALIFRSDRGRFALAIDDVDDVMSLDLATLRDAPGSDVAEAVVLGVARNGDAIVALVDADALVLACQAIPVLELV